MSARKPTAAERIERLEEQTAWVVEAVAAIKKGLEERVENTQALLATAQRTLAGELDREETAP